MSREIDDLISKIDIQISILERKKEKLKKMKKSSENDVNYDKYLNSYSGRRLLEKHSLDEYGSWIVKGEDANCDLGGAHHMPHIGTVEGKLINVIKWAVSQNNFWTWGAGGEITKSVYTKV